MEENTGGNGSEEKSGLASVSGSEKSGERGVVEQIKRGRGRPKKLEGKYEKPSIETGDNGDDGDTGGKIREGNTGGGTKNDGAKTRKSHKKKTQNYFLAPDTQDRIAVFFENLNNEFSEAADVPELKIKEKDAKAIVDGVDKLLVYYAPEVAVNEGAALIFGLIFTVAMIYGPGIFAIIKRKARERKLERENVKKIEERNESD